MPVKPTRLFVAFGVFLLVIVIGLVAAVRWAENRPSDAIHLPNGIEMRLLGTSVGNKPFTTEKPWHKVARRVLPNRLQGWIPAAINGSCGGGTNDVAVYFEVTGPASVANAAPWNSYLTEDDSGFQYFSSSGYCSFGSPRGSTSRIYAVTLRSFPRRQKDFLMRFFDAKKVSLATLRVPNPVTGPFPEWRSESLPTTKTNGPVSLTLASLTDVPSAGYRYARPEWKVTSADPAWAHAKPKYWSFEDATGNEGSFLSLKEPVWKLSTVVHRSRTEDFLPSEKFAVTNLTVPKPGELKILDISTQCAGFKVGIDFLAGAGRLTITNGTTRVMLPPQGNSEGNSTSSDGKTTVERWDSSKPFFMLKTSGLSDDDEVRLHALDEHGKEIKTEFSSSYYGAGGLRTYQEKLLIPDDVKIFSLEIIISHPYRFEFMINPAQMKHDAAKPKH